MEEKKEKIIEIKNLYKNFEVVRGNVKILKNINLTINKGEFLLILGPSGSGKSTLLNTILGLETASSGSLTIYGKDISKMKPDDRAEFRLQHIGIIFQKPDWIKALNVLDNVTFPLALVKKDTKALYAEARKHLDQVGMLDHADYRPYELSAGQQELVEFARALVLDPTIIVADEPTGNLDSESANKVMGMFKDLNEKQDKTIIMVTHNIGHLKYASRTIYLKDGQILDGMKPDDAELEEIETQPVI